MAEDPSGKGRASPVMNSTERFTVCLKIGLGFLSCAFDLKLMPIASGLGPFLDTSLIFG